MKSRLSLYTIGIVIVLIGFLLGLNSVIQLHKADSFTHLSPNDIRGSAVKYQEKLYTLNFAQQNNLIDQLNQLQETPKTIQLKSHPPLDISQIILYLFKAPELTITLIETAQGELLLHIPKWSIDSYFKMSPSDQEMRTLLKEATKKTI